MLPLVVALIVAPSPDARRPWYIDDSAHRRAMTTELTRLAKAGKCLSPDEVAKRTKTDGRANLTLPAPGTTRLDPEDVYLRAKPATFAFGCVRSPAAGGDWEDGNFATAWAAADGVLVTCWHLFESPERGHYGAADDKGTVYPLAEILAVDRTADVAVVRVAGTGFRTLPVATDPPAVGAWVGVLSHPGHQWWTFTQGHVSRYTKNFGGPDFVGERWMCVTADYAGGSSGGPVLDKFGNVVGLACLTSNIDYEDEKEKPRADESKVQMVVKLTVPAAAVRKVLTGGTVKK